MEWAQLFSADKQPTHADIEAYIASPLWAELNRFLHESYEIEPIYTYSTCSGQPGWNVKYQKAGRALCTLYPMPGFFIALVVIGAKEQVEADLCMPTCSEYTQALYASVGSFMGARWLGLHITDENVLADTKRLIQIRRKIKRRA